MTSCVCLGQATEQQFGEKRAAKDLAKYRNAGPGSTTRLLLVGLVKAGRSAGSLLDIGSGVGALTFELLEQGMTRALGVDLSSAYVAASSAEAARRDCSARFVHGDFLDLAGQLPTADVVTLDRVVCCYPHYEPLLKQSLYHAERHFALSYPRDLWHIRAWFALQNFIRKRRGIAFRTFLHSAPAMQRVIQRCGFALLSRGYTWTWCADVYVRSRA